MVVVVVAGWMLKDGDQCGNARRRLPVASAGDAWVEGGMSPGLGRCPQKGIKIPPRLEQSVSLLFLFSSSGVGSSLFPMWVKRPPLPPARVYPRSRTSGRGPDLSNSSGFLLFTFIWDYVLNTLLFSSEAAGLFGGLKNDLGHVTRCPLSSSVTWERRLATHVFRDRVVGMWVYLGGQMGTILVSTGVSCWLP